MSSLADRMGGGYQPPILTEPKGGRIPAPDKPDGDATGAATSRDETQPGNVRPDRTGQR
jgi:hypothetical protein